MKINEKELIKQIRSPRNHLVWSLQDDVHYFTNRHWAVKYEALPSPVLVALFSAFEAIPENGCTLHTTSGVPQKADTLTDIRKVMTMTEAWKPARITDVILDRHEKMRVIENEAGGYHFVNDSYIRLFEDSDGWAMCAGARDAVFFAGGDLLILPYRMEKVEYVEVIQNLISDTALFDFCSGPEVPA